MSKFKAGDKIQCTGCIDQIDQDGDAYVRSPGGNSKNLTVILAKELERAKLIKPALDVKKPMRNRHSGEVVRYIGPLSDGRIVVEELSGDPATPAANVLAPSELENVPEEKRKVWAKYYLVENGFMVPIPPNLYMESIHGKIIGQKVLEITEGDGMEDEG